VLFPYAALFVALSFVTMCFVKHGDARAEAKKGLGPTSANTTYMIGWIEVYIVVSR